MKFIRDPLYGYIPLDQISIQILDLPELQRLRRIRQLGFAYLVYPSANHTRFEHSLGVFHLASQIQSLLKLDCLELKLAGLIHDAGHGPFSHASEEFLRRHLGKGHEQLVPSSLLKSLDQLGLDSGYLIQLLTQLAGLAKLFNSELSLDRMDYLCRDAYYTGVCYGTVDIPRLIHQLKLKDGELVLDSGGIYAAEALLVSRLLMKPSVYYHHVSRIAECMFLEALEWMHSRKLLDPLELLEMDDHQITVAMANTQGFPAQIIRRIHQRKLFKRAIQLEPAPDIDPKSVKHELAQQLGIPPEYVLVDLMQPEPPQPELLLEWQGELKPLEQISPLARAISEQLSLTKLGIYVPEEHRILAGKLASKLVC